MGLTLRHTRGHLTRAVLEGVAFSMRDCFGLLKEAGLGSVQQVRVAGGGAKSPLWRKICASVLGVELVTVNSTEGAAYGAALLAAVGQGAFPSVPAACAAAISITGRTPPEPAWSRASTPSRYRRSIRAASSPRLSTSFRPPEPLLIRSGRDGLRIRLERRPARGPIISGRAPSMPRLLVVDDDPHVSRTLVELLALHGFEADARGVRPSRASTASAREPSTWCSSTCACRG